MRSNKLASRHRRDACLIAVFVSLFGLTEFWGGHATAQTDLTDSIKSAGQCVTFVWNRNAHDGYKWGSISIPVNFAGKVVNFQLDTGSNTDVIYGSTADSLRLTRPDDDHFLSPDLEIGSTVIKRPLIYVDRSAKATQEASGTLGLRDLIGHLVVIDFPRQRFCIFDPGDVSLSGKEISWVEGSIRNGKFFVSITGAGFQSDAIIYDSGSSEFSLLVDNNRWQALTGLTSPSEGTERIVGSAWGKLKYWRGAPSTVELRMGDITLHRPLVFTDPDQPTAFNNWPFRAEGVLGNALFLNQILILDLTAEARIGLLP